MGLLATIYYNKNFRQCAAGGISERFETVCVVNAEGPFHPTPDIPAVELVSMHLGILQRGRRIHVYARPVDKGNGRQYMHGGSFISTSDSRFNEAVEKLGGVGSVAIQLHDRQE